MELQDRVALVTGGTGGLGAVIARKLAVEGVHVALTYRERRDDGQAMCAEIKAAGGKAFLVQLDQTDAASCAAAVEATVSHFGRLDILVNNAAMNEPVPFSDLDGLTPELWDMLLSTNLRGPFLLARAAAPHLKRQEQARVVNIAGFAGLAPVGSSIALSVSKAGLIHLTKCLAVALAPTVAVNCVAPGLMAGTRMSARVGPQAIAALKGRIQPVDATH
jgi:3-oxoacyl-[acyl-carrier protein] reductase